VTDKVLRGIAERLGFRELRCRLYQGATLKQVPVCELRGNRAPLSDIGGNTLSDAGLRRLA